MITLPIALRQALFHIDVKFVRLVNQLVLSWETKQFHCKCNGLYMSNRKIVPSTSPLLVQDTRVHHILHEKACEPIAGHSLSSICASLLLAAFVDVDPVGMIMQILNSVGEQKTCIHNEYRGKCYSILLAFPGYI